MRALNIISIYSWIIGIFKLGFFFFPVYCVNELNMSNRMFMLALNSKIHTCKRACNMNRNVKAIFNTYMQMFLILDEKYRCVLCIFCILELRSKHYIVCYKFYELRCIYLSITYQVAYNIYICICIMDFIVFFKCFLILLIMFGHLLSLTFVRLVIQFVTLARAIDIYVYMFLRFWNDISNEISLSLKKTFNVCNSCTCIYVDLNNFHTI